MQNGKQKERRQLEEQLQLEKKLAYLGANPFSNSSELIISEYTEVKLNLENLYVYW